MKAGQHHNATPIGTGSEARNPINEPSSLMLIDQSPSFATSVNSLRQPKVRAANVGRPCLLLFVKFRKMFSKIRQFRQVVIDDVRLVWMIHQVVLVVALGNVKRF